MSTICGACQRNAGVEFAFCPFCGAAATSPPEPSASGTAAPGRAPRNAFDQAETFYQPVVSAGQLAPPSSGQVAPPANGPATPGAPDIAVPNTDQSPAASTEPRDADAPKLESGGELPLAFVIERNGPSLGTIHRLRDFAVIGRGSDADIVLADPAVSKRHAEIRFAAGRFTFEDLGSTNASHKVGPDGSRRPLVGRHVLVDRERLDLGETRLAVVIIDSAGSGGDSA